MKINEVLEMVKENSLWLQMSLSEWIKKDGVLEDLIEAKKLGLLVLPKMFFHLRKKFVEKIFQENQWGVIIIRGPRRVGKTSTIKYLIKSLIEEGYDKNSFIYLSLDNEELLSILEKKKKLRNFLKEIINFFEKKKPLLIVLDEVTFYKGWARAIKNLIDEGALKDRIGLIAMGSYSLDLSSAKSELAGRFGPAGEEVDGDVFFYPYRFVEIAENLLGKDFKDFFRKNIGYIGKRAGLLEYLCNYQTEAEIKKYRYIEILNTAIKKFYQDLHTLLEEVYIFSGGYPKSFFEAISTIRAKNKLFISDARYKQDIFDLFINDAKKFGLDRNLLVKILLNISSPSMLVSKDFSTLFFKIEEIKKDHRQKYISYLESSGLFSLLPNISAPNQIIEKENKVIPSGKLLKLVINDPAVFFSLYLCSRGIEKDIVDEIKILLEKNLRNIKDLLYELSLIHI